MEQNVIEYANLVLTNTLIGQKIAGVNSLDTELNLELENGIELYTEVLNEPELYSGRKAFVRARNNPLNLVMIRIVIRIVGSKGEHYMPFIGCLLQCACMESIQAIRYGFRGIVCSKRNVRKLR